jgi:hypothetical protein
LPIRLPDMVPIRQESFRVLHHKPNPPGAPQAVEEESTAPSRIVLMAISGGGRELRCLASGHALQQSHESGCYILFNAGVHF